MSCLSVTTNNSSQITLVTIVKCPEVDSNAFRMLHTFPSRFQMSSKIKKKRIFHTSCTDYDASIDSRNFCRFSIISFACDVTRYQSTTVIYVWPYQATIAPPAFHLRRVSCFDCFFFHACVLKYFKYIVLPTISATTATDFFF